MTTSRFSQDVMRDIITVLFDGNDRGVMDTARMQDLLREFVDRFAYEASFEGAGNGIFYIADAIKEEITNASH